MDESILDRVLSSREDHEKQSFDAVELVQRLLRLLSDKEADVLRRRFGLSSAGKETLESIGQQYQVTRERIRQIQKQAITSLRKSDEFSGIMQPAEHLVMSFLTHHGSVVTVDVMNESLLLNNADDPTYQRALHFLLSQLLKEKVEVLRQSTAYRAGWKTRLASMALVDQFTITGKAIFEDADHPMTFEEFYEALQQTDLYTSDSMQLNEETVSSYLDVSAAFGRNPFDEYGLSTWGSIRPKRMNDRVHLVLEKQGKPMHFEDIAERISQLFEKKAYAPTVHNELILNDDYVLVGRGIYALKDWGFKEGVVASVIQEVLRAGEKPMTRGEIVAKVLEQRIVKKNTIHLALTDKTLFAKRKDGRYELVQ